MEWESNFSEEARVAEAESDKARVSLAIEGIQQRSARNEILQKGWIDGVVQEDELAPFGGKKNFVRLDGIAHEFSLACDELVLKNDCFYGCFGGNERDRFFGGSGGRLRGGAGYATQSTCLISPLLSND